MLTYFYKTKRYGPLPGSYNELTGKQLIAIAELFEKNLPEDLAHLEALRILMCKTVLGFALLPADAKQRILPDIKWIFDKNTLTEQLLPTLKTSAFAARKKVFAGPKKEFDNLTIGEFHFCEMFYRQLVIDQDEEAINRLVAVLYRKEKPGYNYMLDSEGDARERFNPNEIEYYAGIIKKMPGNIKTAILLFYDGCRQNLLSLYDEVFRGDKGEDNDDGMFGVIRGLAGDTYGDIDKVEQLNIHTALNEISLQLKEAEQYKQEMKKNSK